LANDQSMVIMFMLPIRDKGPSGQHTRHESDMNDTGCLKMYAK